MPVLTDFVKAYDVRGLVPEQLSPDVARALGIAFAEVIAIPGRKDRVVIRARHAPSRLSCRPPLRTVSRGAAST